MHKGNGIRIIAKYFDVDLKDTIGIGDGENDIPIHGNTQNVGMHLTSGTT